MASREHVIKWFLSSTFADAVIRLCVSAIQVFMWLYMMSFYIEASLETRKRRLPYIVASLAILTVFSTASVVGAVGIYQILLEGELPVGADLLDIASLLADCALRIADAVLLYRCYIVWFDRRWVIVFPASLLLANIGINLRSYIPFTFVDSKLDAADIFLIVAVNALITLLISFRLVRAQRQLASVLPQTDRKIYLGIIGVLVESAAPVAVFGVALAIGNLYIEKSFRAFQACSVLRILFACAAILAPQLIIFRVTTGTSWVDRTDTSLMLSRPIQFDRPPQTRADEESGIKGSDR